MDKFSELKAAALAATPGPWMKIDYFWIGRAGAINSEFITCDNGPDAEYIKRVSPDAVLALLAELEAKDKRIADLSVGKVGNALLERENHHVEVVDKMLERIAELEAYNTKLRDWNAGLAQESCELQAKLATPVRLPEKYNMKMAGDKSTKSMFYGHNSAINDCARAICAAGFTAGDE